jgi:hypothetical protein
MHNDGVQIRYPGTQPQNTRAARIHEWIATNIDSDVEAIGLFTLLGLALSLWGLALSWAMLGAMPFLAELPDLLMAGS